MTMVYVVVRLDWDGVEILGVYADETAAKAEEARLAAEEYVLKARYGRITDNSFDVQSFPLL
jgi:hypothetical protein